ncbi:MAG: hypothetical protein ICV64_00625 [Thermoleophilia bacterium]|nr:hypothetical protein [Thermoleophilia bacterium]
MLRRTLALTSCAIASLTLTGSLGAAGAAKPTVGFRSAPQSALPAERVRVAVAVRPSGRMCSLSVTYRNGSRQPGLRAVRATGGRAAWEFVVPDSAPAGPATLRATCRGGGSATRSLAIVGAIVPARISVEQTGFSLRPGRMSGASISYGVILKNQSPNQDAMDITVLVNFVDDQNVLWGSKTTRVFGIAAGTRYALGDSLNFQGVPPVTRLEVTIQIGRRAAATRRPAPLASIPSVRNVRIVPAFHEPQWVGQVDGDVYNDDPRLILERTSFSAVVFDASGSIIGGGNGRSMISLPPSARSVFVLSSGFNAIETIRAASTMISVEPTYRLPGS